PHKKTISRFAAVITGGLMMLVMVAALKGVDSAQMPYGGNPEIGLVKNLGKLLFNEFLLPFEVVSVLLLAAMVGAVMLGKKPLKVVRGDSRKSNDRSPVPADLQTKNVKELTNE